MSRLATLAIGVITWLIIGGLMSASADECLYPDEKPYPDDVTAVNGSVECWDHRAALRHITVFNHGVKGVRYVLRWKFVGSSKVYAHRDRVPRRQGVNDGIVIRPEQTVERAWVTVAGWVIFDRTSPMSGPLRCSRHKNQR